MSSISEHTRAVRLCGSSDGILFCQFRAGLCFARHMGIATLRPSDRGFLGLRLTWFRYRNDNWRATLRTVWHNSTLHVRRTFRLCRCRGGSIHVKRGLLFTRFQRANGFSRDRQAVEKQDDRWSLCAVGPCHLGNFSVQRFLHRLPRQRIGRIEADGRIGCNRDNWSWGVDLQNGWTIE